MTQVKSSFSLAVVGGPVWTINRTDEVEAYDVISVQIAPGAANAEVLVQPGASAQIVVLAIQSSLYGSEITYKASTGLADSSAVTLHGPQILARGLTALFGLDVKSLKFSNAFAAGSQDKTALIQIFVGRDATP